ncbi:translation initiation factor IF-2 N-terminal domain-containing protein [Lentilactobacillus senioris]|uniref:translation initiation factor IF-2 N-terminal domain-containing protein n=1 Tax=Lentilactobacillus senioris TaxID=931534 RepID=UPI000AE37E3D
MGKKRIYELAKELNVSSKEIIDDANRAGYDIKNHMSTVDDAQEKRIRQVFSKQNQKSTTKPTNTASHTNNAGNQNHNSSDAKHSANSNIITTILAIKIMLMDKIEIIIKTVLIILIGMVTKATLVTKIILVVAIKTVRLPVAINQLEINPMATMVVADTVVA